MSLPGSLVALGIASLLWGLLNLAVNALGTVALLNAYRGSVPPPPPVPPPLPRFRLAPHQGDYVRETGLKAPDRAAVMEGLRTRVKLSPDRAAILERFLADGGRDVFGLDPPLSPQAVASAVIESGQNPTGPDGPGALATTYFTTARGRVEVDNTLVTFVPSGGTGTNPDRRMMRGNAYVPSRSSPGHWGARALDEWIEAERQRLQARGADLTPEQASVLLSLVPSPSAVHGMIRKDAAGLFLFEPVPTGALQVEVRPHQFVVARVFTDSSDVRDPRSFGEYFIMPDGRHGSRQQYANGIDPVTGAPNPLPPRPFRPAVSGSPAAVAASAGESALGAALSVVLVVAGILTLARSPGSARLHKLWAVANLVLLGVGVGVAVWWLVTLGSPGAGSGGGGGARVPAPPAAVQTPLWAAAWAAVFGVVIQAAYSFVIFLTLGGDSARTYFLLRSEPTELFPGGSAGAEARRRRLAELAASPVSRVLLGAIAAAAALLAVGHVVSAVTAGGGRGSHVAGALLSSAIAALFGYWLARSVRKRAAVAVTASALALSLTVSPAGAAAQADVPTESRQARVEELTKQILARPPLRPGSPPGSRLGPDRVAYAKLVDELLQAGPEGEAAAFGLLARVPDVEDAVVLQRLEERLRARQFAPFADAVVPAAEQALPRVIDLMLRPPRGEGSSAQRSVLEAMARTPRLVPAIVDGLLSRNLRAELVTSVVGGSDSQALVAALTRGAADSSRAAEARGEAVRVLAKVSGGNAALLSIASGDLPAELKRQNAEQAAAGRDGPPRDTSPRYRLDDDAAAGVRGTALQLLSFARPQPPPELADAAAAALSSNSAELRAAAVSALNDMGDPGRAVLARRLTSPDGPDLPDNAWATVAALVRHPKALLPDGAARSDPRVRSAAGRVLALLLEHADKPEVAARELDRLANDDAADPELRRRAVLALLNAGELNRRMPDQRLGDLLASRHLEVREAVAASLIGEQEVRLRHVSPERLVPLLNSAEVPLRKLAIARLLPDPRTAGDQQPAAVMAALESPHDDVQQAAAKILAARESMKDKVGLVTAHRARRITGRPWSGAGLELEYTPRPWPTPYSLRPAASKVRPAPAAAIAPARMAAVLWPLTWLVLSAALLVPVVLGTMAWLAAPPVRAVPPAAGALSDSHGPRL